MNPTTHIPAPPPRPDDAHKGTFGTVIVIGGCRTMIGAPSLAASAALRAGAGLVKIASSGKVVPHALTIEPGATGLVLPPRPVAVSAILNRADPDGRAVLAVGPGLGRRRRAADIVREVTSGPRAMVLDADALNHLAAAPDHFRPGAPSVMTPHPGEFRRLAAPLNLDGDPTDEADRPRLAGELARAYGATVILKGRHSIVTDGDCVFTNRTGNPALATAGSGDVLTGAVAALMAQGLAPFDAAVLGAHLHGAAADLWRDAHGASGLTARDLADLLPDAFEAARCAS